MALLLFFIVCLSTSSTIYWDGHHMVPFLSSAFFCFFFFLWNKVVESLEWGVFLQIAYAVPHIYLIVIQLFGATDSAVFFLYCFLRMSYYFHTQLLRIAIIFWYIREKKL